MPNMRRRRTGLVNTGMIAALSLIGSVLVGLATAAPTHAAGEAKRQTAAVVAVKDGDTVKVKLASGERRIVRLLGIDAPAVLGMTECGGPRAKSNLGRLLPRGRRITLISDPTQSNKDGDGRLLRYVVKRNGTDVNNAQLSAGWARLRVGKVPFKRIERYRRALETAQDAERGIWGRCPAEVPPSPSSMSPTPDDTGVISGAAFALAAAGDRTILGGRFTHFGGEPRSNVAAVRSDGTADVNFVADTDGKVQALATSTDGSTVFVGGTFSQVNGVPRANLAAVDATTGAVLDGWSADTEGEYSTVLSMAVHGDRLYVGGKFDGIDGTSQRKLAAVGTASGDVITTFNAQANGAVREVVVSPDGGTVYAGGGFTVLSGASRPGNAGAVDASDGTATPFDPFVASGSGVVTVALSPDGSRFFLSTQNNFVRAYDPADGNSPVWSIRASGNTQAIAASSTEVFLGGHWARYREFDVERPFLSSVDSGNGVLTSWDTKCSGDRMGVWGLLVQGDKLHVAGVFSAFGTDAQRGYARFGTLTR